MTKFHSVNGVITPAEEANLNISDISILRGYGLFDFFLVKQGHPLFLQDYIDRFEHSAKQLNLELPLKRKELIRHIYELIDANGEYDSSIRLVLTGGYSADGYAPSNPNLLVMQHGAFPYPEAQYLKGNKLITCEYHRALPTVKATNYVIGINMLPQMQAAGATDVLFHKNGHFSETTRANFYIVTQYGAIVTAGEGILKGITRKQVMEGASGKFTIEERKIAVDEIKYAAEAFITNTTKRVMPIVKIDDVVIGEGKPGPVAAALLDIFKKREVAYLASCEQVEV